MRLGWILIFLMLPGVSALTITVCAAGCNQTSIVGAINGAASGDTIFIGSGVYEENVVVNKSITLTGNGSAYTVLAAPNGAGTALKVSASNVVVTSLALNQSNTSQPVLSVQNADNTTLHQLVVFNSTTTDSSEGLHATNATNLVLNESVIERFVECFLVENSVNVTIMSSNFTDCSISMSISGSNDSTVTQSVFNGYDLGVWPYSNSNTILISNNSFVGADATSWGPVCDSNSQWCVIENNTIQRGEAGIWLESSTNHVVRGNTVFNVTYAVGLDAVTNVSIYNNLFNSTSDVQFANLITGVRWNTSKTLAVNIVGGSYRGGNFWAKANGSGFSETCTDATPLDGICDSTYQLNNSQVDSLPLKPASDGDGDGVPDETDTVHGNASSVNASGTTSISVQIGNGTINNTASGTQAVVIANSGNPLVNFSFNFSATTLNLSKITITLATNSILINLSDQLQSGMSKTVYLEDKGYDELCVLDAAVASIDGVSSDCTAANETDFASCIGDSGGVTIGDLTCTDEGSWLRVEGLRHSAIVGDFAPEVEVVSGGGGGGGGSSRSLCGDAVCRYYETCSTCPEDCGVCESAQEVPSPETIVEEVESSVDEVRLDEASTRDSDAQNEAAAAAPPDQLIATGEEDHSAHSRNNSLLWWLAGIAIVAILFTSFLFWRRTREPPKPLQLPPPPNGY